MEVLLPWEIGLPSLLFQPPGVPQDVLERLPFSLGRHAGYEPGDGLFNLSGKARPLPPALHRALLLFFQGFGSGTGEGYCSQSTLKGPAQSLKTSFERLPSKFSKEEKFLKLVL